MQMLKSKLSVILIVALLVGSIGISVIPAQAHTPAWQITTFAYISAAPNPVGVGQTTNIVFWLDTVIQGAGITNNIRFQNYNLTIVAPDGTKTEKIYPTVTDTTSSQYYQFTPSQVGTYNLYFNFPGQVYQFGTAGGAYNNDTYTPSSASATLTVQQTAVTGLPAIPLPTEYWSRPIFGQNHQWSQISSNWLAGAATADLWQKSGTSPTSAHIVWTKPLEYGGLTGDLTTQYGQDALTAPTYYSGFSYNTRFSNPIIMQGVLYYQEPNAETGGNGQAVAVDLATGKELWRSSTFIPTKASLVEYESANQHGVVGSLLWMVSGTTWVGYNGANNQWLMNLTNVPSGTEVYTNEGEILRYILSYNATAKTGRVLVWNSTAAILSQSLINNEPGWPNGGSTTTTGAVGTGVVIDASKPACYSANYTFAADLSGSTAPAIVGVLPGDLILGRSSSIGLVSQPNPNSNPWTMWALNDKAGSKGNLMWLKNYAAPEGNQTEMLSMQPIDPVTREFTTTRFETGQRLAYSLDTGAKVFGPVGPSMPPQFQYYSAREGLPAYGNLYVGGYGGVVYCYSMIDGSLLWTYGNGGAGNSTNTGSDTPWGNYPTHIAAFANGVVYTMSGEHSPNTPLYLGYRARALNATTGEELYTLLDWSASGLGTSNAPVAIADGYMVFANAYDGQLYNLGKGPTQTAVTIQNNVIEQGSSLLIQGTVMDISVGTKQTQQAARFPTGVPAVSDASQTAWMEYVYQQQPCPTNTVGVTVTLMALDPNGNYANIGTATSDANGLFAINFTPTVPGIYHIYATFSGSNSYWGSQAENVVSVTSAPAVTAAPTPAPASVVEQYFIPAVAALAILIVVVGVALMLVLRKHP
jgi:hypothetical protein